MPGTSLVDEIELVLDDIRGGGKNPPPGGGDGGGDGESSGKRHGPQVPAARRYATAIILGMVSIVMFFMGMVAAFLFLVWLNTIILLISSGVIELARRGLDHDDVPRFQKLWVGATALGFLFLTGQLVAWREMVTAGFYVATNQASSFFYIFTGLHGLHLLGGIAVLVYVARRNFARASVSRAAAAEVASYYWHFMDGLWIFLLMLMYLGK